MKEIAIKQAQILIIDDEPINIQILEALLAGEGYQNLRPFTDPFAAIESMEQIPADIILLDLHMPHLDGFGVMERVVPPLASNEFLPIVVLTADMTPMIKRRALAAGASDYITKPFDPEEVLLRVGNLLITRQAHSQIQNQNEILEVKVHERTSELLESNRMLQRSQFETLERLALACEYRDDITGNHTQRVGNNAARLAAALGLSEDYAELMRRAAPLHDIGKIGIPDSILLKAGRLTPEEFDVMKTHTTIGASMISGSNSSLLQLAEELALSHHERWDGAGYPKGLAGDDIPLSGRIVSVCDVFDALTNERPYKKAWPLGDALAEIESQAGKQFDRELVKAFISLPPVQNGNS